MPENEELKGNLKDTYLVQKCEPLLLMRTVPFELGELKILDTYLARINSHDEKCRTVTFTKAEYEQLMGLTDTRPQTLKKYLKSMLQKVVEVPLDKGYMFFSLFESAKCEKDEYDQWTIELECSEKAKALFFGIEKLGYLQYELKSILALTSKYSFLLYLYLRKERYRFDWVISLEELREKRLDIKKNDYYKTFKRFNDDILKKAVSEINEKTDIKFTYSTEKTGKRVTSIRFQLIKNLAEADENQLTLEDTIFSSDGENLLSSAVNNEFTVAQMDEIFSIICVMDIPKVMNSVDLGRFHYLKEKYSLLNVAAERAAHKGKPIKDRYKYFVTLLKK